MTFSSDSYVQLMTTRFKEYGEDCSASHADIRKQPHANVLPAIAFTFSEIPFCELQFDRMHAEPARAANAIRG